MSSKFLSMNYKNISEAGAEAIATTIRVATVNVDRNMMVRLDRRHGGIKRITRMLMLAGFMTKKERLAAIRTMPKIKNPSCKITVG